MGRWLMLRVVERLIGMAADCTPPSAHHPVDVRRWHTMLSMPVSTSQYQSVRRECRCHPSTSGQPGPLPRCLLCHQKQPLQVTASLAWRSLGCLLHSMLVLKDRKIYTFFRSFFPSSSTHPPHLHPPFLHPSFPPPHSSLYPLITMGACCGKSDRKDQGHVLGSLSSATNTTNTTTTTTTTTKTTTTSTTKPKPSKQAGGQSLGAGPQSPTHKPGEMSALAAQQRAEAVSC
ncbi:hypothetical protein B0O80DRAFT_154033 [Mortierella sp. GBAus27b]|nr:hypothetical protein B0O80DRAFT_154033 [Mortierella sp. GBAus27b]